MSNKSFRCQFIKAGCGFIGGAASTVLFSDFAAVLAQSTGQLEWRFCRKCQTLFFNGYRNKGACAAGGVHVAEGYNFLLPHDIPGTPTSQTDWRPHTKTGNAEILQCSD